MDGSNSNSEEIMKLTLIAVLIAAWMMVTPSAVAQGDAWWFGWDNGMDVINNNPPGSIPLIMYYNYMHDLCAWAGLGDPDYIQECLGGAAAAWNTQ